MNPELDGRFNGCSLPFQFVNPYYHELTTRTCANLLDTNLNRMPSAPIEYRIGCDCVFPFAMNLKGDCVQEEECSEREAFGEANNTKRNEKDKAAEFSPTSKTDQRTKRSPSKDQQPLWSQSWSQPMQPQPLAPKHDFHTISTISEIPKY